MKAEDFIKFLDEQTLTALKHSDVSPRAFQMLPGKKDQLIPGGMTSKGIGYRFVPKNFQELSGAQAFFTETEALELAQSIIDYVKNEWKSPEDQGFTFFEVIVTRTVSSSVVLKLPKDQPIPGEKPGKFLRVLEKAAEEQVDHDDWDMENIEDNLEWHEIKRIPESQACHFEQTTVTQEDLK